MSAKLRPISAFFNFEKNQESRGANLSGKGPLSIFVMDFLARSSQTFNAIMRRSSVMVVNPLVTLKLGSFLPK
jgi:hypothetical protein